MILFLFSLCQGFQILLYFTENLMSTKVLSYLWDLLFYFYHKVQTKKKNNKLFVTCSFFHFIHNLIRWTKRLGLKTKYDLISSRIIVEAASAIPNRSSSFSFFKLYHEFVHNLNLVILKHTTDFYPRFFVIIIFLSYLF